METKKCFKCGQVQPMTAFYKHPGMADGRLGKCIECAKSDVKENRAKRIDYYREYDRDRFQNDPRVKERHTRYQSTESGKLSANQSKKKWLRNNADKRAAHIILGNAVRDGRIIKPILCSECGRRGRIHGHHTDYSKPLDVMWRCPRCHRAEHTLHPEI